MTALPDWDVASDAELASSAAAGDRGAFAGIYDRYADRLYDFCIGMVRDRDAAADCVQDAFCTAAATLTQLSDPDKLRPWLYAIARSKALRCLRHRRREQVSDELPEEVAGDPSPQTLAERTELADLVAEAAGGLTERDRSVLELTYRHGLDGPELAEALGVSPANANRMVSRLRQTVEQSLGALLVARRSQSNPDGCPELRATLAGWDGRFSILMRKRIARHIESCTVCQQERKRMVNPVALLGAVPVFIPAPAWLRDHTLHQIQLTAAETDLGAPGSQDGTPGYPSPLAASPTNGFAGLAGATAATVEFAAVDGKALDDERPDDRRHRTERLLLLLLLLALIISGAVAIPWVRQRSVPIAPAELTGTPAATTAQPATTAVSPTHAPPPPFMNTPISSITAPQSTSVRASATVAVPTPTAAPPPPAPPSVSHGSTTHPLTTTPSIAVPTVGPPVTSVPSHDHAPANNPPPRNHLS